MIPLFLRTIRLSVVFKIRLIVARPTGLSGEWRRGGRTQGLYVSGARPLTTLYSEGLSVRGMNPINVRDMRSCYVTDHCKATIIITAVT